MPIVVRINIDFNNIAKKIKDAIDIRVLRAFQRASKEAVSFAKSIRAERYTDQSGALNSSTGFQLYKDGQLIDESFEPAIGGDGSGIERGIAAGRQTASERASALNAHICGVIVAGMSYSIYVESKGRDVLTATKHEFPAILDKWMQAAFQDTNISYSITDE
jgi:hypothetical protein